MTWLAKWAAHLVVAVLVLLLGVWGGLILARHHFQWCADALSGRTALEKWRTCNQLTHNYNHRTDASAVWMDLADGVITATADSRR